MSAQKSILYKAKLVLGFPILFAGHLAWAEGEASAPANNGSGSCALNDDLDPLSDADKAAVQISAAGVKIDLSQWKQKREECKSKNLSAQRECLEACSANAQKGLGGAAAISGLMDIVNGLTNKTCGQQQQASKDMKQGYESYSAACKATQSACNMSCAEAEKGGKDILKQAQAACQSAPPDKQSACNAGVQLLSAAIQKDGQKDIKFVAGKIDQCKRDFSNRLAGAAEVLKGIGQMLQGGKQCEDESVASSDSKTKTCAELSEAERMQRQDCICEISSFNPGCENAGGSNGNSPTFGGSEFEVPGSGTSTNVEANTPKPDSNLFPSSGSGGSGAGGLGGGMLAGGMGGAGGMTAASADKEDEAGKKKDANIFAGEGGGGGGGGSWGFGSGGSDANGKAGAAGVGARGLASKPADPTLTGAGGRDNWQKVKLRYSDNRPTFLDEQ